MKRAIGRNGFKKIYGYTWENQGENKKVFRAKIKGLTVRSSLKSFLSLILPLRYGKVNSRTGKKLRYLYQDKHTPYTQNSILCVNKSFRKQKITLKTQKLLKTTDKIINDGSAERSL